MSTYICCKSWSNPILSSFINYYRIWHYQMFGMSTTMDGTSGAVTAYLILPEHMSSNCVLKRLVLLFFVYDLLTMDIVCVFVCSLLHVFLRFETFKYTLCIFKRFLIWGNQTTCAAFHCYDALLCYFFCNFLIEFLFLNSCIYVFATNIQSMQFVFSIRTSAG